VNKRETLNLVNLVAHLCPAMRVEDGTDQAWHMVIGHLEAEDCVAACRLIAARKPFIAASDIVEEVKAIRSRRLDAANHVFEPRIDEDALQANTRLALERRRAASLGASAPGRLMLTGPDRPVRVPPTIGKLVADVRAARNHPALKLKCPWQPCHAQPGDWCRKHTGAGHIEHRAVTGFLHPGRVEAAGMEFTPNVPQSTAQDQASRQAAALLAEAEAS
jgi:hypothetical protein